MKLFKTSKFLKNKMWCKKCYL